MNSYRVIGIMSGTSLDGVDMACCEFTRSRGRWQYRISRALTVRYTARWKQKLTSLEHAAAFDFVQAHMEYGHYLGRLVRDFMDKGRINQVDFIASHGHTIFHQPDKGITFQIGHGAGIAAECQLPVITDFRSLDIALGGQGAPLVPIGDQLLFSAYDYCLNLGGFANISYDHEGRRLAFDVCPVNIVLNDLCRPLGKAFDDKGNTGKKGNVHAGLLDELNRIRFYRAAQGPKSLGKEWVLAFFYPILEKYRIPVPDQLRTVYEHIALQVVKTLPPKGTKKVLVTGGGAYNVFLMERIRALTQHQVIIPDKATIEFKEALIFAFLGVLRSRGEVNCLRSVTGTRRDHCGGGIYQY